MSKRLDRGFSSYKCECSYLLRLKSRIIVLKKISTGDDLFGYKFM